MTVRLAINGFGRIGRLVMRSIIESGRKDVRIVGINDLGSAEMNGHLLKYDSVHGVLNEDVKVDGDTIDVGYGPIKVSAERDPANLPWGDIGVDIAMECTGFFTKRDDAAKHIAAGAKKVLISAPGKEVDQTIVYGVNSDLLTAEDTVVSNASCTTNCLAPVADVLNKTVGIEKGFMTTVHSYTGDQRPLDALHSDPRRARAAALNIIPTSTGAAAAVGLVLPELVGKLDGTSVRVPTPNVSLIDLTFTSGRDTTVEEINVAMKEASEGRLNGVLGYNTLPLVSTDFNHNPASSSFDATQTQVVGGNFVRVLSWYDNEWGFSSRMPDTAVAMMNAS
ncbi:MAG: type I glyceraldehyde-3-phosphate dehydrogenase [Rhodospirillales bacterium]|jgi:glyceraldehyde 3-phosphate dehydrogenase|tara:strand:+ start:103 stop:1110 length:1008 start_codon:yes stop_codon:yes gene_type:complete